MQKNKKIIFCTSVGIIVLVISIVLGLLFTGLYIGWGPFKSLFWSQEVNRVNKKYPPKENQDEIVFYGASNFRLWHEMENDLNEYKVVNAGFGGSTDKLLVKYADKLLYPYNPKIVFFQTGSNDYVEASGTDEEKIKSSIEYKKEMFQTFHEKLPQAKFVIMSGLILPGRSQYTKMTIKINSLLEEYASSLDYISYVDANDLTYDGTKYRDDLFESDGIHLNHHGQLNWCNDYIKPMIEELLIKYEDLGSVKK